MNTTSTFYCDEDLSPERATIISYLKKSLAYASMDHPFAPEVGEGWEKSIQTQIDKTRYGCYYVTLLGGFSSGKSTLINAMIGQKLLPVSTSPTTAVQTEIYEGNKLSIFIPMGQVESSIAQEIETDIRELIAPCSYRIITELTRGNMVYPGIGVEFPDQAIKQMATVIAEISAEKRRRNDTLSALKDFLASTADIQILLSLNSWPKWLKNIVLTDVPGTGSVHDYHEKIINQVIPHSQLILYILEADRIGAALDKKFCNKISNIHKRKIFYIVNKADRQNKDIIQETLNDAGCLVPDTEPNGVKPEFLPVSALCALEASQLENEERSYHNIIDDDELNITQATLDSRWKNTSSDKEKNNITIQYLRRRSFFNQLQDRIEQYLRHENKDLALAETAAALVKDFAAAYLHDSEQKKAILNKEYDISDLKKQKEQKEKLRRSHQAEAELVISDFVKNLDFPESRLYRDFSELLTLMRNDIISRIDRETSTDSQLQQLVDNDYAKYNKILTSMITTWSKEFDQKKNERLQDEVKSLDARIKPIVQKIIDTKLAAFECAAIRPDAPNPPQGSISNEEIAGIGTFLTTSICTSLALSGVGVTTTWSLFGSGSIAAVFGMPLVVCAPLALAAAGLGLFLFLNGNRKRFKKNRDKLRQSLRDETLPDLEKKIREHIQEQTSEQIKQIADAYKQALAQLLTEMKNDEDKILELICARKEERDRNIAAWEEKASQLKELANQVCTQLK